MSKNDSTTKQTSSCHAAKDRPDLLLWVSLVSVSLLYLFHWQISRLETFQSAAAIFVSELSASVFALMNTMWWGILIGMVMVALLSKIPREFIIALLGTGTGIKGIIRATVGGMLLDLCSHGILMVGAKLYERGVSSGQLMAFLIASPWNSFSLTIILIALIGLYWTLVFVIASLLIAVITGVAFEVLTDKRILPANPHQFVLPVDFDFWREAKSQLGELRITKEFVWSMLRDGVRESRMVLRWLFFGVLLASLVRALMDASLFQTYFGPTALGLGLTLIAATVIEVCSEGSTPIAADILTRANAPGNSFAFLMTGVSTDYTEIMVLRDVTNSWRMALFLPLLTVPQVVVFAWFLNAFPPAS